MLAWVYARIRGNSDIGVIVNTQAFFARTKCDVASNGVETRGGWPCIFTEMPHLCTFDNEQVSSHFCVSTDPTPPAVG